MERQHHYIVPLGIALLTMGLLIRFWIGKRRFNRRNPAGMQQFTSYEAALWVRLLETLGNLIAYSLIAAGLLLFAAASFIHFKF